LGALRFDLGALGLDLMAPLLASRGSLRVGVGCTSSDRWLVTVGHVFETVRFVLRLVCIWLETVGNWLETGLFLVPLAGPCCAELEG
jgi:hypothetical protein